MAHASNHAVTRSTRGTAAWRTTLAPARECRDNARMEIVLNGEQRALANPITVLELLQAEGLGERRVAVEVNGEIVPRSRHGERALREGDRIEIVHALGGG
jgi:sulfur carrier protein